MFAGRHSRPPWGRFSKRRHPILICTRIDPCTNRDQTDLFHSLKHAPGVETAAGGINYEAMAGLWSQEYARRLEAGTAGTLMDITVHQSLSYTPAPACGHAGVVRALPDGTPPPAV